MIGLQALDDKLSYGMDWFPVEGIFDNGHWSLPGYSGVGVAGYEAVRVGRAKSVGSVVAEFLFVLVFDER